MTIVVQISHLNQNQHDMTSNSNILIPTTFNENNGYNLCAIVHNNNFGHYTATVKVDNNWILVSNNDLEVVLAPEKEAIEKTTAEILFYRKGKEVAEG